MALNDSFILGNATGLAAPKLLGEASSTTAGGVYMAKLGDYMFSLDTSAFQTLERQTTYNWAAQNRIGRKPALQYTGEGEDTITLSGAIYPHFRGGLAQLGLMREAAGRGEPLPLVYAFETVGQYVGLWSITQVRETRTVFFRDGVPRKIEFTLQLSAYGEDMGSDGLVSAGAQFDSIDDLLGIAAAPSLMGVDGSKLMLTEASLDNMPSIDAASSLTDIQRVSAGISDVARSVSGAVTWAQNTIANGVASIVDGVAAIIPPEAVNAALDLARIGGEVWAVAESVQTTVDMLPGNIEHIRNAARNMGTSIADYERMASASAASVSSVASALSNIGNSDGQNPVDRLVAAASMGNINRAAKGLVYTLQAGQRMSNKITGLIDG